ncbi:MAG: hypothetical protein ABI658_06855 [Acidimicrobiales bacterium]
MSRPIMSEATIHPHQHSHTHLQHPLVDLRHLGRDAIIAAEIGLSATVVVASGKTTVREPEVAVVQQGPITVNVPLAVEVQVGTLGVVAIVRGLDSSAANTVSLVNDDGGEPVMPVLTESGLRFEDVPAGSYHVVVSSEGPILQVGNAAVSSEVIVRSTSFALLTPGNVVVESR